MLTYFYLYNNIYTDDDNFVIVHKMNDKLTNILKDIGLTDKEAKVYISTLALGQTTITKIANSSQIKRTTVYSVVESLKQKGLISERIQGWKTFYVAESPRKVDALIEAKRKSFLEKISDFEAIQNVSGSEGIIKHYEGVEAIKTVYEDVLKEIKKDDFYYVMGDADKLFSLDEKYFRNFLKRRSKITQNVKVIVVEFGEGKKFKKFEKNMGQEVRFISKNNVVSTDFFLVPNKLILTNLEPPVMSIVIENKSIIYLQKMMFEMIWDSLK